MRRNAAHEHAPPGLGDWIDVVGLEGDRPAVADMIERRTCPCPEEDHTVGVEAVHRENGQSVGRVVECEAAKVAAVQ